MNIFLYGTLADPTGFGYCAGRPVLAAPISAVLPGYRRVLLRHARYPTLRRAPKQSVTGVLMRINADMLNRLQNYESTRYRRIKIRVQTPAGPRQALCFYGDAPTRTPWRPPVANQITLRSRSF